MRLLLLVTAVWMIDLQPVDCFGIQGFRGIPPLGVKPVLQESLQINVQSYKISSGIRRSTNLGIYYVGVPPNKCQKSLYRKVTILWTI
jgi:hypothetical protein